MWASVADTLRRTVLPSVTDPHARATTIQLIGLATYAGERGADRTGQRHEELAAALGPAAGHDVLRSCTAVLSDPYHPAYGVVRRMLERHLDEDLRAEAVLLEALRGRLRNG